MNDSLLNKNIIEAIRSAYTAPTEESVASKSAERQGVMARTQSKMNRALKDTAQDALVSVEDLIGKTMDARTDKDVSMKELGKLIMDATDPQEPAPVSEDPDRQFSGSGVDIEDRFPEDKISDTIADESTAPLSEVDPERRADEEFLRTGVPPAAETGEGLMTRPSISSPDITEEAETTTASSLTDLIYTDFVEDKQEGDEPHVGLDNKNITLAGGVVPDGLVYKGATFTQDNAEVVDFDVTKLDTSAAYKKVGDTTIKRSDYDTDVAFAKGVIKAFEDKAAAAAGSSWDSMSEGSKKAVVKLGWNKGVGFYTGKTAKAIYKELAKEEPDASQLYSKILVGSTVKDKGASIGIAKARANAWNETISATGGSEITKVVADNSGTNTKFKYYDKDGSLLHTEQTNRASTIYENGKNVLVEKNSKGKW